MDGQPKRALKRTRRARVAGHQPHGFEASSLACLHQLWHCSGHSELSQSRGANYRTAAESVCIQSRYRKSSNQVLSFLRPMACFRREIPLKVLVLQCRNRSKNWKGNALEPLLLRSLSWRRPLHVFRARVTLEQIERVDFQPEHRSGRNCSCEAVFQQARIRQLGQL